MKGVIDLKKYISQVFKKSETTSDTNYFSNKLQHETDIADLAFDYFHSLIDYIIIDVRSKKNYEEYHIPGAISYPNGNIPTGEISNKEKIIVYCWGPSCNGATKAAYRLSKQGFNVKELIGGIEYWIKEACPIDGTSMPTQDIHWKYSNLE